MYRICEWSKVHFQKTNKNISLLELKSLMLERIKKLEGEFSLDEWKKSVESASDIKELISGY